MAESTVRSSLDLSSWKKIYSLGRGFSRIPDISAVLLWQLINVAAHKKNNASFLLIEKIIFVN
jgi:hypothetical protein